MCVRILKLSFPARSLDAGGDDFLLGRLVSDVALVLKLCATELARALVATPVGVDGETLDTVDAHLLALG